jgi:uncharacterized membrane protein YdjX (TVP38/TMEM64 family)
MAVSRATGHALRLGALAALLMGGWLLWRMPAVQHMVAWQQVSALRGHLAEAWWGPPAFVLAYSALTALDFSGLVLTVAGGVVFGFERGLVLNTIGANLGASAAYWLARVLGRDAVAALLGARLSRVQRIAGAGGFLWLLRLRLIPVVPFDLLNLAAGLAGTPWRTFAAATALGILPGTVIYTWFAAAIAAGSREASRGALTQLLIAGLVLLLLTFAPAVARRLGWSSVVR